MIDDRRMELYRHGWADKAIARAVCRSPKAIREWRRAQGLPLNSYAPACPALSALRRQLYDRGLNDCEISRVQGVHATSVREWRLRRKLPPNQPKYRLPLYEQQIRELHAAGYSDERISRIMFRYKTFGHYWRRKLGLPRNCEPQFRARPDAGRAPTATVRILSIADLSLDAPAGPGTTLGERLVDPSWSDWLEEMGATVW